MSEYCDCCKNNIEWIQKRFGLKFLEVLETPRDSIFRTVINTLQHEKASKIPTEDEIDAWLDEAKAANLHPFVKRYAIHQAGHAVMAHHYKIRIESIPIGDDIDLIEDVKTKNTQDYGDKLQENTQIKSLDLLPKEIRNRCRFYMAGIGAEDIYDQMRDTFIPLRCDKEVDNIRILLQATPYSDLDVAFAVKYFLHPLSGLLTLKWRAIETLSNHLVNKYFDNAECITGSKAQKIIARALTTMRFKVKSPFALSVPLIYNLWCDGDESVLLRELL